MGNVAAPSWPGQDWSSELLENLMIFRGARGDKAELLAQARLPGHKLAPTLLGLYEREGGLIDEQAVELATYRDCFTEYRRILHELRSAVPGITPMKGLATAQYYPPGLVRAAADLDLWCTPDQMWQVGATLENWGWAVDKFLLLPHGQQCELVVVYQRPGTPQDAPAGTVAGEVELKTVEYLREIPGMRYPFPVVRPVVRNVLALLAERAEQPFRSRDLLDAAVLLHAMDASDTAEMGPGLDAALLWPAWREIRGLLLRLGWLPPHVAGLREGISAGKKRITGAVRRLAPIRLAERLLHRTYHPGHAAWLGRFSSAFHLRGGTTRATRAGVAMDSVPLGDERSEDLRVWRRGPHLVATTPLGSFLVVAGSYHPDWLTQAGDATDQRAVTFSR